MKRGKQSRCKGMSFFKKKTKLEKIATIGDVTLALNRVSPNEYKRYLHTDKMGNKLLSLKAKAAFYKGEPLSGAAIDKTASMLVDKWFEMDDPTRGNSMDETTNELLVQEHRRLELPANMEWLIKQSMAFGNGYLEIIPEIGNTPTRDPFTNLQGIDHFAKIESEFMLEHIIPEKNGTYFFVERRPDGTEVYHHESRILHLPWFQIGSDPIGFGVYDRCFRSIVQKIKMDFAVGQVIYQHGHPFIVLNIEDAKKKDIEKGMKLLNKLSPDTGFVGTDKHKFTMLNPSPVDPDNFAKYYYINQAAACEMPMFEFMGAQRGQVTGGEVDLGGWYNILASKQKSKLNPLMHKVNNILLDGTWTDEIFWNPIHVDQKQQAELDKLRIESVKIAYNDASLITDTEARQLLRDYGIPIPEDDSEYLGEKEEEPELPEGFEPYEEEEDE